MHEIDIQEIARRNAWLTKQERQSKIRRFHLQAEAEEKAVEENQPVKVKRTKGRKLVSPVPTQAPSPSIYDQTPAPRSSAVESRRIKADFHQ